MNKTEAEKTLNDSRKKIDEIDEQIVNLILSRTALAQDIISSKKALGMDLFDASREDIIHKKIKSMVEKENVNTDKVLQIFDLLASISKEEQKKYL